MHFRINPRIYRIRSEPETCTRSTDCYDINAECIYSLKESHHICCKPRSDVIFPECPDGREMLIMGKYMPVLCSVENSIENDMCPEGYECLPSATTFMRHNGQSYNICCKAI
ncbi:hypothetical protein DINM_000553 [Dirofilaria immitis]|nr:hypothetical protein [Dirofilaria immitis]